MSQHLPVISNVGNAEHAHSTRSETFIRVLEAVLPLGGLYEKTY